MIGSHQLIEIQPDFRGKAAAPAQIQGTPVHVISFAEQKELFSGKAGQWQRQDIRAMMLPANDVGLREPGTAEFVIYRILGGNSQQNMIFEQGNAFIKGFVVDAAVDNQVEIFG